MLIFGHLKMLLSVLLYFAVMSMITIAVDSSNLPDSAMWNVFFAWFILFVPMFFIAANYAFSWKALDKPPVSDKEIHRLLGEFSINGLSFSYDKRRGVYLLSPVNLTRKIFRNNKSYSLKFYTRVWLDPIKHRAKFCDYLIEDKHISQSLSFTRIKSFQKGMITFSINEYSSDGESFKFSTNEMHKKLINTFTENGWSVKGKVM